MARLKYPAQSGLIIAGVVISSLSFLAVDAHAQKRGGVLGGVVGGVTSTLGGVTSGVVGGVSGLTGGLTKNGSGPLGGPNGQFFSGQGFLSGAAFPTSGNTNAPLQQ